MPPSCLMSYLGFNKIHAVKKKKIHILEIRVQQSYKKNKKQKTSPGKEIQVK